jgi:excinuclease UvrABC nuclease subunit
MSLLLLEKDEIESKKEKISSVPIVYFLFMGNEIVYIGKSESGYARIDKHIKEGTKIFDSYSYIKCFGGMLSRYEKAYIEKYKPKYNKIYNDPCKHFTLDENGKKTIRVKYTNHFRSRGSRRSYFLKQAQIGLI